MCSTFDLGDEDEVIKELSANPDEFEVWGEYTGDVVGYMSIDLMQIIYFDISHNFNFAVIDDINSLSAAKNDPFLMIIKDEYGLKLECKTCAGEGEMEEEGKYIDCEECEEQEKGECISYHLKPSLIEI